MKHLQLLRSKKIYDNRDEAVDAMIHNSHNMVDGEPLIVSYYSDEEKTYHSVRYVLGIFNLEANKIFMFDVNSEDTDKLQNEIDSLSSDTNADITELSGAVANNLIAVQNNLDSKIERVRQTADSGLTVANTSYKNAAYNRELIDTLSGDFNTYKEEQETQRENDNQDVKDELAKKLNITDFNDYSSTTESKLNDEIKNRESGDTELNERIFILSSDTDSKIEKESNERISADTALDEKINSLSASNKSDLDNEIKLRISGDTTLGNKIDSEIASISAATDSLIATEKSERESGDTSLSEKIDSNINSLSATVDSLIANEKSERESGDTQLKETLENEINSLSSDTDSKLKQEIENRESADKALGERIDNLSSDTDSKIANEKAERISGDTEVKKALESDLNAFSATITTQLNDESSAREKGDTDLSNSLKSNVDALSAAIDTKLATVDFDTWKKQNEKDVDAKLDLKLDKTTFNEFKANDDTAHKTINDLIATKADKTDVTSQLATKVDNTTFESFKESNNSALDLKANKADVETTLKDYSLTTDIDAKLAKKQDVTQFHTINGQALTGGTGDIDLIIDCGEY